MSNALRILILAPVLLSMSVYADDSSDFDSLWKDISQKSHGIRAEESESASTQFRSKRASRHWMPRLLLNAQVISTNDPGNTLFSNLNSRSLLATDLNPASMNEPTRQWFKRGGLTLDWSLFEGGSRVAASRGSSLELQSHALALESRKSEEYAELARDYSKLIALNSEATAYTALKERLQILLSRYKLGSKDNPVGYSGLLGMRALLNRLDSALDQTSTEVGSLSNTLQIKSGRGDKPLQAPAGTNAVAFIDGKLELQGAVGSRSSLRAEAMRLGADAAAEYAKAERARWLPKVGLMASGNVTSGPRDSGTSTEYGAYLQWEIFNAGNFGAYSESSTRAVAAQERSNEMTQNTEIIRKSLSKSIPMLRENLNRMNDSIEITLEQVGVTERLFRNGSINALQFVEVLSRRTDVIQGKRQIEYAYIEGVTANYIQNVGAK